ncbi:MAG: hypothetical protein Kow0080_23890 [Candidatus Promineifilaceae bacterium]
MRRFARAQTIYCPFGETTALTVSEIIACLKRIQRSIEMWQKEGGRRGYFEFINQFLPKEQKKQGLIGRIKNSEE